MYAWTGLGSGYWTESWFNNIIIIELKVTWNIILDLEFTIESQLTILAHVSDIKIFTLIVLLQLDVKWCVNLSKCTASTGVITWV